MAKDPNGELGVSIAYTHDVAVLPVKVVKYANVYRDSNGFVNLGNMLDTVELAKQVSMKDSLRIATARIEWEEE